MLDPFYLRCIISLHVKSALDYCPYMFSGASEADCSAPEVFELRRADFSLLYSAAIARYCVRKGRKGETTRTLVIYS